MELANRLTLKNEIYDNVSKQHNTTINKLEEVKRKLDELSITNLPKVMAKSFAPAQFIPHGNSYRER